MKKIEKALKNIEVGKAYYYKQFAGKERFWCVLLKKQSNPERPCAMQVQELKEDDPWDAPTGRVLEVGLQELYYHWVDMNAIL